MKPTILFLWREQTGTLEQLYFCRLLRNCSSTWDSSLTMNTLSRGIIQFLIFFSLKSMVFCSILISSGRYPYSLLSCRYKIDRRFSGVSTILSSWWPSQLSSTQVIGRTKMYRMNCRKRMKGAKKQPIDTLCCPVQQAWGSTSPKTTTATVEMMIARQLGTILSRKIGSASKERELESSRVDRRRWCWLRISRMGLATLRSYSLSELIQICISVLLMDMQPTVSPEQTPAKQESRNEMRAQMQKKGEEGGMRGSSQAADCIVQLTRMAASSIRWPRIADLYIYQEYLKKQSQIHGVFLAACRSAYNQVWFLQRMSVWIKLLKIGLEQLPVNPLVLAVYSDNEEIITEEVGPGLSPSWSLNLLLNRKVKIVSFAVQEVILPRKYHVVGQAHLYLYNLRQHPPNTPITKILTLKKAVKDKIDINSELARLAGTIRLEIEYEEEVTLLGEMERIYSEEEETTPEVQRNATEDVDRTQPDLRQYEEISISEVKPAEDIRESLIRSLTLSDNDREIKPEEPFYVVDSNGYINLKKKETKVEFADILPPIEEKLSVVEERLKLSVEEIREFSQLDPSHLRQSAVVKHIRIKSDKPGLPKKPQIFQRNPVHNQTHIAVKKDTQMFEIYHMCCGEEFDEEKHTREDSY